MSDILNYETWYVKMFVYLNALGIHIYLATIKDSYFINGKYYEANAKDIHALKSTLNDEYLSKVSNTDLAFVVWNNFITLGEQAPYDKESNSDEGSTTSNMYYMVQRDDPLEVNSESELDEDVDMSFDEITLFCQQLLEKSDLLKKDNKSLKNKYDSISKEKDSFQNKYECISK